MSQGKSGGAFVAQVAGLGFPLRCLDNQPLEVALGFQLVAPVLLALLLAQVLGEQVAQLQPDSSQHVSRFAAGVAVNQGAAILAA
ncbi:hypothetical protein D3C85_1788200 [compost metagenome]